MARCLPVLAASLAFHASCAVPPPLAAPGDQVSLRVLFKPRGEEWHTVVLHDGRVRAGWKEPGPPWEYRHREVVEEAWALARQVREGISPGLYSWKVYADETRIVTIRMGGEESVYTLTPGSDRTPPPALMRLQGALSGMYAW